MARYVALLRGINVGARTRVPMVELRALCEALGWAGVETYIQSGNVVFGAKESRAELESALEDELERHFGSAIPVIARSAHEWPAILSGNPFGEAAEGEPNLLMLCLAKQPLASEAGTEIAERARDGERVRRVGEALWIHYPAGAGRSRLSPSLINRLAGSPVTARNWRTAVRLGEMLAAPV